MVPAEETVEALLDSLVTPLLPRRGDSNIPALEQQESVAKQMYAVVVLYNYYHRKLFPQLEFLDFKSFCKVSCISKPSLLKYMKSIYKGDARSGDLDEHLSVTEKMIMDACNVSLALDVSKDAPVMEGWPISKVAVFLVDPCKEYCLLRSNSRTQPVMSIVENDLAKPLENVFCVPKTEDMLGSKTNESLALQDKINFIEDILQEAAFSTVEKEMGISYSNLSILGRHLSYSLSHLKSCTRLYIMSYIGPISGQIPVNEVIESLHGPLVKINNGTPEVTTVIQYYSLLPYIDILSDSLIRETPHTSLQPNTSHEKMDSCSNKTNAVNETVGKNEKEHPVVELFIRSRDGAISSLTKEVLPSLNGKAKEDSLPASKQNLDSVISKKRKVERSLETDHHYKADDSFIEHNLELSIREGETSLSNSISHNSVDNVERGHNQVGDMKEIIVKTNCDDPLASSKKLDVLSVLQMLKAKRNDLCQQHRLLEDNISHCEMSILRVISGTETSASEIESMLIACGCIHSSETKKDAQPKTIGRKRLCEAVLCLQSPCQELDEIFCTNNWILPKYCVLPSSDGRFQALVSVRGTDFESECKGDCKNSPREARESAAANMLRKLRDMAAQPHH